MDINMALLCPSSMESTLPGPLRCIISTQTYFSLYEHVILSSLQHHMNPMAVQEKVTQTKIKSVHHSGRQLGQIKSPPVLSLWSSR